MQEPLINYYSINLVSNWDVSRAGRNEREAPGKVVTSRPPKRFEQLPSYHVASFQLRRSIGQKVKFDMIGSLYLRDNSGLPCTVRKWLICSNRKLYHKKCICYSDTTQQFLCHIDSLNIFTGQITHSLVYWGQICLDSLTDQNSTPVTKMLKIHAK